MSKGDERLRSVLDNCQQVEKNLAGICIIILPFPETN